MKKIRVCVVGAGYLGKFHAEKYAKMPGVDLVGVVDLDAARAEEIAGEFNTGHYTDYRDLLGRVDAVSIVVPTQSHFEVGKEFLMHGADVMVEKPMTTTVDEAEKLIRIAEDYDRIIQVGHLERFNPVVVELEGVIRRPLFIESHRLSTYKGRGVDVSVVHDLMIHDIDIICHFVKAPVIHIHASGAPVVTEHVDIASARLEFENGCVANITSSRLSLKNERKIRFFQKDAYISVDFARSEYTLIRKNPSVSGGLIPGMEINLKKCPKDDALYAELASFIDSVVTRRSPIVSGRKGRDALKVALDVIQQIEKGLAGHSEIR